MIPLDVYTALNEPTPSIDASAAEWSAFRDRITAALEHLNAILRSEDEAELVRMQQQMAALQARLTGQAAAGMAKVQAPPAIIAAGSRPEVIAALATPAKRRPEIDADGIVAPPSYAETDAGAGRGGGREPPMTTEDFNAELADLRDRTTSKRARSGLA